jgi:hypothetical protein
MTLSTLVKEIGAPGENQRPNASHKQTLSYYFALSTPRHAITTTTTMFRTRM